MGNKPNKWIGLAAAVVLAAVSGVVSFYIGSWIGDKLAYGFTFDWYVSHPEDAYTAAHVIENVGVAAALAAFLSVLLNAGGTAWTTQLLMKRLRYTPPRYSQPVGVSVAAVRLLVALPVAIGLFSALLAYVLFATPMLETGATGARGSMIEHVTPAGFQLLNASASAFGGFVATLVTILTIQNGLVSGRIVPKDRLNVIARISLFGMRNAKTTVALVLAVTLVAGYYATSINTNVDAADVLPRGDPNTAAAHNLTEKFKSSFTQQLTFQLRVLNKSEPAHVALYEQENAEKLPFRTTEPDISNISDELYIRAQAELIEFVVAREPFAGSSGTADLYKLINWTIAGGTTDQNVDGDAAFSIPPADEEGSARYAMVDQGVTNVGTVFAAVDALTSPTWRQTAALVTVSPGADVSAKEIGKRGLEVREEWLRAVEEGRTEYKVFGPDNPPQFTVDLPLANAHASELTAHDFKVLLPIIAAFIAVTLFIAFRNATNVVATFLMLAFAVIWTFGVMGALKIPLNTLNLAVVPLIMGVGIDYGIHMMNEYQEKRGEGHSAEESWIEAGGGSALALFIGMLTTAAGLVVMIVSPSLIVAQLGILANIALVSCYVLAILFIPAVVTLLGDRGVKKKVEYQPSQIMPRLATGVSRTRWAALLLILLLTGAALASASTIHREAFGDPPRNWLPDDPLRQEHERALAGFYDTGNDDVKANILIFEGDMTNPAAHRYIAAITSTLRANDAAGTYVDPRTNTTHESRVIGDTLKDAPFIMNTYLTVRGGLPGAGKYLGAEALAPRFAQMGVDDPTGQTQNYPQTSEEIRALLDEVFDSPLYQFGNIFIDHPTYDMAVTVFSVRAATYEDAEAVWNEIQAAIAANEALRPDDVRTSFYGNTAINYLFVAKQVPWLTYMSIATNILVILIVFAFTRDIRATAVVGALNFLTSTFWIGVLPLFGIGLAINLTLPLVFIFCMGSDYALHLSLRCKKTGDTYAAMEGVGKGVLYSFVTTFGSFLLFTQVSDLSGQRSMIATAIAIALVFVTTMLVVPIFYPVRKKDLEKRGNRDVPVVETRSVPVRGPAPVLEEPRETRGGGSE